MRHKGSNMKQNNFATLIKLFSLIALLALSESAFSQESDEVIKKIKLPNAEVNLLSSKRTTVLSAKGGWQPTFKNEQLVGIFAILQERLEVERRECKTADKIFVASQLNMALAKQPEDVVDISGYSNAVKNCLFSLDLDK